MSAAPKGQYAALLTSTNRRVNDRYFHHPDPGGHTCAAAAFAKYAALDHEAGLKLQLVTVKGLAGPHAVLFVTTPDDGVWVLDNLRPWPERRETLEALGYHFVSP